MFVVCSGNPFDGMTMYGPFSSGNRATDWASDVLDGEEWHVVELKDPDDAE